MKHQKIWFKSLLYAINGLLLVTYEKNMRIHILASVAVILLSYIIGLTFIEWGFICSAIALVLTAECFNTCIEYICDMITTDYSTNIKQIKDIAAAAVLINTLYALAISCFILLPKILHLTTYNYVY